MDFALNDGNLNINIEKSMNRINFVNIYKHSISAKEEDVVKLWKYVWYETEPSDC